MGGLIQDNWWYSDGAHCPSRSFTCYFEALSRCSEEQVTLGLRPWQLDGEGQLLKLRRGTEDERVVYTDLRLDNYLNLKQHRLHVPEAVAHRGLLWWRGQLALYMLRPNAYVTHLLQIEFQSLAWHQHAGLSCFSVSLASLLLCLFCFSASLSLLLLCPSCFFVSLPPAVSTFQECSKEGSKEGMAHTRVQQREDGLGNMAMASINYVCQVHVSSRHMPQGSGTLRLKESWCQAGHFVAGRCHAGHLVAGRLIERDWCG